MHPTYRWSIPIDAGRVVRPLDGYAQGAEYFHQQFDTETCARSVIEFDRLANDVDDVVMLMVSYDLPFAHKRFGDEHELQNTFGLSAVRHEGFGENYGVQIGDGPFAGMFARAVVVLDENNTVVHSRAG